MFLSFNVNQQASVSKSDALTEAHRKEEFNSEVSNIDSYIKEVETSIKETETGTTLTTVKAQYTKHKVINHRCGSLIMH